MSRPGTGCVCCLAGLPNAAPAHGAGDEARSSRKQQQGTHNDPQKTWQAHLKQHSHGPAIANCLF